LRISLQYNRAKNREPLARRVPLGISLAAEMLQGRSQTL
jgi:hypothetical protein